MKKFLCFAILLFGIVIKGGASSNEKHSRVVTTIKPLTSMALALVKGCKTITVSQLLDDTASPHHASLKPSQYVGLKHADVIVWVGSFFESSLAQAFEAYKEKCLTLQSIKNLQLLSLRFSCSHHHSSNDHSHSHSKDGHIWTDPFIMESVVEEMAKTFMRLSPKEAHIIEKNMKYLFKKLQALHAHISHTFSSLSNKNYVITHDSLQYMDKRYGLRCVDIFYNHHQELTPKKQLKLKGVLTKTPYLFFEKGFNKSILKNFQDKQTLFIAELDLLGRDICLNEHSYFTIMYQLCESINQCLKQNPK
jgi:zinc transport system substrate-binding protein